MSQTGSSSHLEAFSLKQTRSSFIVEWTGGGEVTDSLCGELTSHRGKELPICLDDGGNLPQYDPGLESCVYTKGKYQKLIHLVHVGEVEVLLAVWVNWYLKARILQIYLEREVSSFCITRN